ncbi:MAG: GAF domain-containing protein, partial [Myxococcales bacterium]
MERGLSELVGQGLLVKVSNEYSFAHPTLHTAARGGLPEAERRALRAKVGLLMLDALGDKDPGDQVFTIAEHLNDGFEGTSLEIKDVQRVVRVNALAGVRALGAASYDSAVVFFEAASGRVDAALKGVDFPLCYRVALARAKALHLAGKHDEGERAFEEVLTWQLSLAQISETGSSRVMLLTMQPGRMEQAVRAGLDGLRRCGMSFGIKPSPLGLVFALIQVVLVLRRRSDAALTATREATDERTLALARLISSVGPPAFWLDRKLFVRLHLANMLLNLRQGFTPVIPYALARHTIIASGVLHDFKTAIRLIGLIDALHARFPDPQFWPRTQAVVAIFVKAWTTPIRSMIEPLARIARECEESGDVEYATYSTKSRVDAMWVGGTNLRLLGPVCEEAHRATLRFGYPDVATIEHASMTLIRRLTGKEPLDEADPIAMAEPNAASIKAPRYFSVARGLILLYLFDRWREAFDYAEDTRDIHDVGMGQPLVPEHQFFHGMAAARVVAAGGPDAERARKRLVELTGKLRKLVGPCRANNLHRYEMLLAEGTRLSGEHTKALVHYSKATAHAEKEELVHMQALAHERRGSLLAEMGLHGESTLFYLQAFEAYRSWGAYAKTKLLEQQVPKLVELRATVRATTRNTTVEGTPPSRVGATLSTTLQQNSATTSSSSQSSSLDVKTLLGVAQAVSEELSVDGVLRRVLEGALTNAGAQRGLFVMRKDGKFVVDGEAKMGGFFGRPAVPLEGYEEASQGVLRLVQRSGERMALDDASSDERFARDPYVLRSHARSILCAPIVHQGATVGLLYLENHGVAGAFTAQRLEVLRVLSTQAAISLDNAVLYANLEARVAERTCELNERNQAMRLVLDNVEQGFLSINQQGMVSDERSAIVDRWFGPCGPSTTLADYLRPHAPDTAGMFALGWEALLDGFLPMELCLDQLPQRMVIGDRHFEIAYRPILDDAPEPALLNCLVVVTDVTSDVERERMEAEQHQTVQLFERIARDRAGVVEFAAEAGRMVELIAGPTIESLAEMKRVIHTLKGNAGIFGLSQIASHCHAIEVEMEETEGFPSAGMRTELQSHWAVVDSKLQLWLGERSGRVLEIDDDEYRGALAALRAGEPYSVIIDRINAWTLEPMQKRLARIGDQVTRLATRIGKSVRVDIEAGRVRLDAEHWGAFWGSLVHVVRNAVDHGLETPDERLAAGKGAEGRVVLRTLRSADELRIEIEDDGRGVDWDRLAEKALRIGLPAATHEDRVRAMFADGVSTRDEASELSGRGVGAGAVLRECEGRGGRVIVRSERGHGTCFSFVFPVTEATPRLMPPLVSVPPLQRTSVRPSH